jgi:hypothetical protein
MWIIPKTRYKTRNTAVMGTSGIMEGLPPRP